jgi:hypothetical protein
VGSSKKTEQKKAGDAWAVETFGMTITKRLSVGECADDDTADMAIATLLNKIAWNDKVIVKFRDITNTAMQENARVAPHYERLHRALHDYKKTNKIGSLIEAQAAVWRMAYTTKPSDRQENIPELVRMLVLLNLRKDATAMYRTFLS